MITQQISADQTLREVENSKIILERTFSIKSPPKAPLVFFNKKVTIQILEEDQEILTEEQEIPIEIGHNTISLVGQEGISTEMKPKDQPSFTSLGSPAFENQECLKFEKVAEEPTHYGDFGSTFTLGKAQQHGQTTIISHQQDRVSLHNGNHRSDNILNTLALSSLKRDQTISSGSQNEPKIVITNKSKIDCFQQQSSKNIRRYGTGTSGMGSTSN